MIVSPSRIYTDSPIHTHTLDMYIPGEMHIYVRTYTYV